MDAQGRPQSRIINVMLALDEGMVIVTSRGKPFWKQLTESGLVALSAMCPECQSLKFTGSVRRMEDSRAWVDEVFLHNPGMNEVYPGQSRYALDAFLIYEGGANGLTCCTIRFPCKRFAYGGTEMELVGFSILETCTGCGACFESARSSALCPAHPIRSPRCTACSAGCAPSIARLRPSVAARIT